MNKVKLVVVAAVLAAPMTAVAADTAEAGPRLSRLFRVGHTLRVFRHTQPRIYVYRRDTTYRETTYREPSRSQETRQRREAAPKIAQNNPSPNAARHKADRCRGRVYDPDSMVWFDGGKQCWTGTQPWSFKNNAWYYGSSRWYPANGGWQTDTADPRPPWAATRSQHLPRSRRPRKKSYALMHQIARRSRRWSRPSPCGRRRRRLLRRLPTAGPTAKSTSQSSVRQCSCPAKARPAGGALSYVESGAPPRVAGRWCRGVDRFPATIADVIAGLAAAGGEVDPVRHLIVTATGSREGRHLSQHPAKHERWQDDLEAQREGRARRRLRVDQPLQISEGYFEQNNLNAYTLNNLMATKNADGSAAVQFGGCDGNIRDCLPAMPSWNSLGAAPSPACRNPQRHGNSRWRCPSRQARERCSNRVAGYSSDIGVKLQAAWTD